MILFKELELLERIHKLIRTSRTGTPDLFAKRLGISVRRLYDVIDEMKDRGAPIQYSRSVGTYYYKEAFEIDIICSFRRLSEEEQQDTSAGYKTCHFFSSLLVWCSEPAYFCSIKRYY